MPRAGWCRECGEWVWVDEEGACQHGHGPECVGGVYDATPKVPEHRFGEGELPSSVYRFNWGAFCLPVFWGLSYGVWPLIGIWFAAALAPLTLVSLLVDGRPQLPLDSLIIVAVVAQVAEGLARLWSGTSAGRLLWRRESLRAEFIEGYSSPITVERFAASQRSWRLWGGILLALAMALIVPYEFHEWQKYGLPSQGAAIPVIFLLVELVLGYWLAARMREELPDAPPRQGEAS